MNLPCGEPLNLQSKICGTERSFPSISHGPAIYSNFYDFSISFIYTTELAQLEFLFKRRVGAQISYHKACFKFEVFKRNFVPPYVKVRPAKVFNYNSNIVSLVMKRRRLHHRQKGKLIFAKLLGSFSWRFFCFVMFRECEIKSRTTVGESR